MAEIVATTHGPVIGSLEEGIHVFRGVPYAAAPFGPNRFRAPIAPEPWHEPLPALQFGATAPQQVFANQGSLPEVPEPIIPGEEVLTVNVWSADLAPRTLAPVLVWIHGGGFFAGCSANPWYDGTSFARAGLVVASLNYRLGVEGFLEIAGADENRALRDWIAALEWVRNNASAFGGNPEQVTAMGQSAGGIALAALLTSRRARGLFHRVIIASGITRGNAQTREQAAITAAIIANHFHIRPDREAICTLTPAELVAAQGWLQMPATLEDRIALAATGTMPFLPWVPLIDGDYLDGTLFSTMTESWGNQVPMLVGTTENEFQWMAVRSAPAWQEAQMLGQAFTDALFRRPTEDFVAARSTSAPTYRYEFQWKSREDPVVIGSGHSLDIPFFFNTLNAPYVESYTGPHPPQELADAMHGAFARFALTGEPGWPDYHQDDSGSVMIFDEPSRTAKGVHLD